MSRQPAPRPRSASPACRTTSSRCSTRPTASRGSELYPLSQRMDDEEWWPAEAFAKIGATGYFGITGARDIRRRRARPVRQRPRAAGLRALEPRAGAELGRAREPVPLQHLPQRQRGAAPALPAGAVQRHADRRARPDRAGRRLRRDGLDAHHGAARRRRLRAQRQQDLHHQRAGRRRAAGLRQDRPRQGRERHLGLHRREGLPGFKVAQKLVKMGFRGSQTGELVFEDCRVPADNLLGEEDRGVRVVMSGLDLERAMVAPLCLGIAERALQLAHRATRARASSSASRSRNFQMIAAKLADMYVWVETMRLFTYRALRAANDLEIGGGGRGEIHKISAASVMFAADTLNQVLDKAVQIHGGSGYIWESEINRLYRTIKLLEIGAGTTEVRKLIIADELLRE